MGAPQLIDIAEFMNHLKAEGLVIVRADEIGVSAHIHLADFRKRMMKKKSISFSDVLKMQVLPVKTVNGLASWVERNLKPDETYQETKGKKCRMIMTSAIRRFYE